MYPMSLMLSPWTLPLQFALIPPMSTVVLSYASTSSPSLQGFAGGIESEVFRVGSLEVVKVFLLQFSNRIRAAGDTASDDRAEGIVRAIPPSVGEIKSSGDGGFREQRLVFLMQLAQRASHHGSEGRSPFLEFLFDPCDKILGSGSAISLRNASFS
jgi:hypothetical protein